jgi:hypothetical protein
VGRDVKTVYLFRKKGVGETLRPGAAAQETVNYLRVIVMPDPDGSSNKEIYDAYPERTPQRRARGAAAGD